MKKILILFLILLIPQFIYATDYSISKRKTVNSSGLSNDIVRVLALPVTDFNVDFYYRVEEYDRRLTQKDLETIKQVIGEEVSLRMVQVIEAMTQAMQQQQILQVPLETPTSETPVPPVVEIPGNTTDICHTKPLNIPANIQQVFTNNCVVCHQDDKKAIYNFKDYTKWQDGRWVSLSSTDAWNISNAIDTGYMPKNAQHLNDETNEIVKRWAEENNR